MADWVNRAVNRGRQIARSLRRRPWVYQLDVLIRRLLRRTIRFMVSEDLGRRKAPATVHGIPKKSQSGTLMEAAREFWFGDTKDSLELLGTRVTRDDIYVHGGPDRDIRCSTCQLSEWISRIRRKNLFLEHMCAEADRVRELCVRQGSDLWTHLHQNFSFAFGCDPSLLAPKCLCIAPDHRIGANYFRRLTSRRLDVWALVWQRRLACVCQVDIVTQPSGDQWWMGYDFVVTFNTGSPVIYQRPPIPVVLYCHDFWEFEDDYQRVISQVAPDVLLTPYPGEWQRRFEIPRQTRIVFSPLSNSSFFAKANLGAKDVDLIVLGPIDHPIYEGRRRLDTQVRRLNGKYRIEFNYTFNADIVNLEGPCLLRVGEKLYVRALNKWSEYLGDARYCVFGRMKFDILVAKYYETLGSGAIPILPEVPDIKLLGLRSFEHYIPLSEVENRNDRLIRLLDQYEDYRYITENAVKWHEAASDKMLFVDFEELVAEITGNQYPRRLA